jgi:hypothetical protein
MALRAEIDRLKALVERAVTLLRETGHPHHAKRLEMDFRGEQYSVREKARLAKREAWGLQE